MSSHDNLVLRRDRHRAAASSKRLFVDVAVGQDAPVDQMSIPGNNFLPVGVLLAAAVRTGHSDTQRVAPRLTRGRHTAHVGGHARLGWIRVARWLVATTPVRTRRRASPQYNGSKTNDNGSAYHNVPNPTSTRDAVTVAPVQFHCRLPLAAADAATLAMGSIRLRIFGLSRPMRTPRLPAPSPW